MTISYVNSGVTTGHPYTVTPPYFAAPAAGQLGILQVVSGHPNDNVPSTPSGWTLAGSFSGGGGTFSSGTGPRRLTYFVRVMTGGDTPPTTSIPSGSAGSAIAGTINILSRSAGTGWRWTTSFGDDQTSGTAFSAAGATSLTWKPGDFAWISYALPLSTVTLSAQAVAAAGVTFGAVSSRYTIAVATGNGLCTAAASASVSSGSATAAPTVSATLSAATTGVAGVLRIREATSDVNAAPQSVFPPRNLVSVTGLLADDVTSVTVYRQVGTDLTPVRAASGINVTGQSSLLRVDAEQPFGVSLNYAAILTDVYGQQWTVYSGPITSTVTSDVISDAIRGVGAAVKIESPLEKKRDRDATQFNAGGRIVVVGRPRSAASSTITVRTETDQDGDALNDILDNATDGVILLRKQTSMTRLDGTYALLSDNEAPTWYDEYRWFTLDVVKADDWADVLEAAGFTLQDIANNFSTLADIASFFTTLLAIAQYDFG
ncbi:hypothetical protein AB0N14_13450 [Streptomyces sp. NPDC051104]|uniref:hypothetical protein n=1 Tax=Streptomyces sp. NPDC051104 TaxID=3155044 RepID=UPI00342B87E5